MMFSLLDERGIFCIAENIHGRSVNLESMSLRHSK